LDVSIAPDTPRTVRSDEGRIRQILVNLVDNAVKFTERGGVRMVVELEARPGSTARVRFTVEDTGPGIPADQKDRLFTRFGQVDDSTTRRHGGAGLGLAISRQLVEMLGGEIGFSIETGAGSRFWFDLPLGLPVGTASPEELPVADNQVSRLGCGLRVLVADDNQINRRVVTRLLEQAGCAVDIAPNGQDAVRLVRAGRYDAVLMDIYMPDMDGYQATAAIRALPGDAALTPVIALTASVMPEDRKKCQDAGMDDYVAKPVSLKALIDALNRFARRPVQPPL
jgi:two-component system sensor histidine kinase/response regulator